MTDTQERSVTGNTSTSTLPANAEPGSKHTPITKDFRYFPIPRRLQYDPEHPPHFSLLLNIVFGLASTFIVANLYYCQPLLIQFADSFNVSNDVVSRIPTLVQAGYAVGLLTISPLGDLVRRRPLILILTFLSGSLSIGLAITKSLVAFEALSFLVGVFSIVPQVLMPLAADLAPPERRASALSIVLAGLLMGVLVARVLAGVVAQFVTWRVVYYIAIAVQWVLLFVLWAVLPDWPAKNTHLSYFGILWSMGKFTLTEPLLIQAVLINIASSACFTNFWVTLTFLLGENPYNYSTLVIGLFGLVGIFGVTMAPLVGRVIDRLIPWSATVVATCALLVFQAIQTAAGGINIAAVVIVSFGIDVFRQTQQVSMTTAVFGLDASARARLNAVLIISLFIGQVMGTAVGTEVFNKYGWRPAASLSLAWTGWCLVIILLRGPHCQRYTWFGYEGGCELRKSRVLEKQRAKEAQQEQEQAMAVGGTATRDAENRGSCEKAEGRSADEDAERANGDGDNGMQVLERERCQDREKDPSALV